MIAPAGRKALAPMLGKARFQRVFEKLHAVALAGMNFGEGNHPLFSGEKYVIRYLRDRVLSATNPLIVFDVGANVGVYTRALLAELADKAIVYAFEPATKTFEILENHVGSNENVKLYALGFGHEEASATLYSAGEGSKLGSLYDTTARLSRLGLAVEELESVNLTTIDLFCEREGVDRIHLLKLDVEGHELKVLEGSRGMLASGRIDALQFEFGAANVDSRTFFRDFFDLLSDRYELFRVLQDGLFPVREYRETYEVYKRATNYLALRRPLVPAGAARGSAALR